MVAVAWTAIGLLAATLLGSLYWLGSRIDAQAARIDALVSEVSQFGARMEILTARFETQLAHHAG
jgi:hypothetical protein